MKYYTRILPALFLLGAWMFFEGSCFAPTAAAQVPGQGQGPGARQEGGEGQSQQGGNQGQGRRGRRGRFGQGAEGQQGEQPQQNAGGNNENRGGGLFGGRGRGRRGGTGNENSGGGATEPNAGGRGPGGPAISAAPVDPKELARLTIEQNDRNRDGMLQADEQRAIRGRVATADIDKNGVITRDELEASFAAGGGMQSGPGRGGPRGEERSGSDNSDSQDRGRQGRGNDEGNNENRNSSGNNERNNNEGGGNRNREQAARNAADKEAMTAKVFASPMAEKSYRFKASKDTLPKEGLPSWFASLDANRDGQVGMNEYTAAWTDSKLSEFNRRDSNGDGMITPEEALKAR